MIYNLILIFPLENKIFLISMQYFIIILFSIIAQLKRNHKNNFKIIHFDFELENVFPLIVMLIFIIISIISMYPDMIVRRGTDIVRASQRGMVKEQGGCRIREEVCEVNWSQAMYRDNQRHQCSAYRAALPGCGHWR